MDKKLKELVEAVEHMRDMQKTYFKTRDKDILQRSKRAEKEGDRIINDISYPSTLTQIELF